MITKIVELGAADLVWNQGAHATHHESPTFYVGSGQYQRAIAVDPTPRYPHDRERVARVLEQCESAFPIADRATLAIVDRDTLAGWNGITYEDAIHKRDDGTPWEDDWGPCQCGDATCQRRIKVGGQGHTIVLFGKQVPIHPAVTRYLVAHEYGHAAFNRARRLYQVSESRDSEFAAKYMAVRGEVDWKQPRSARWHQQADEVIANDFRILVAGQEVEFWQHDVPHPMKVPAIAKWWEDAVSRARTPTP